jgi:flagellar hook-length control protein FliK
MSIESGSATTSHKAMGGVDHRGGKKSAKADSVAGDASGGFSMLLGMLSASDGTTNSLVIASNADAVTTGSMPSVPLSNDINMPLAQSGHAMTAIHSEANASSNVSQSEQVIGQTADINGLTLDAKGGFQRGNALAAMLGSSPNTQSKGLPDFSVDAPKPIHFNAPSVLVETQLPQASGQLADVGGVTLDANGGFQRGNALGAILGNPSDTQSKGLSVIGETALKAINTIVPTAVVTSGVAQQVTTLVKTNAPLTALATVVPEADIGQAPLALPDSQPAAKGVLQVSSLSAVQTEPRDVRAHPSTLDLAARTEVGGTLAQMNGVVDSLLRPQERVVAKSPLTRSGDASDGAFGLTSGVNARADAPYTIEATAAAVPDTAIAETVSYWAAQGVQNAELTLDGFGSDPVAVSISLNGDQAQVDFRTDQADVRQALEAATADLRDLLLGEGLQLAGVSVGSSGGRAAQGNPQQSSPGTRQVVLPQEPNAAATGVRHSNPSVGRSLDLFV